MASENSDPIINTSIPPEDLPAKLKARAVAFMEGDRDTYFIDTDYEIDVSAANAIETLVRERDEARAEYAHMRDNAERYIAERDELVSVVQDLAQFFEGQTFKEDDPIGLAWLDVHLVIETIKKRKHDAKIAQREKEDGE